MELPSKFISFIDKDNKVINFGVITRVNNSTNSYSVQLLMKNENNNVNDIPKLVYYPHEILDVSIDLVESYICVLHINFFTSPFKIIYRREMRDLYAIEYEFSKEVKDLW